MKTTIAEKLIKQLHLRKTFNLKLFYVRGLVGAIVPDWCNSQGLLKAAAKEFGRPPKGEEKEGEEQDEHSRTKEAR